MFFVDREYPPYHFACMPKKTDLDAADDETVQVVISKFPKTLLDEIDARAKAANRTRTGEIRHLLSERLSARREQQAA